MLFEKEEREKQEEKVRSHVVSLLNANILEAAPSIPSTFFALPTESFIIQIYNS